MNGGQPPFSYLLKQGGVAATHNGANFVNPIVSSNQSVVFGDASDLTGSYGMPSGAYTCEITDSNNCVVTTSEIVISQTEEATTTQATAATTLATAATTLATIPTTPATDATTLATDATTLATDATTLATPATTLATTLAPTYSLSVNSPVNEGSDMTFTLTTTGLQDGDVVPFGLGGTAVVNVGQPWLGDYSPVTPTEFVITNNSATYTVTTYEDNLTESGGNETIILTLAAFDTQGNGTFSESVTGEIVDTSINPTTLATTTLPTFTCTEAGLIVDDGITGDGLSYENVGTGTSITPTSQQSGNTEYTVTITVPATNTFGTPYSNAGASIECTDFAIGTDPTTLATTLAPLEHTFYEFHAGGGSVAPYSDLSAGGTFYLSTGASTQDLSVLMADLIANGDGQTNGNGVAMPSVNSFEFSGPITGNDCGTSWTSNVSAGLNFFWLAVPNNADFTENLITDGVLQYDCNGQPYNANNRTAFTYNAESYWLYKLAAAPASNAQTYGFK